MADLDLIEKQETTEEIFHGHLLHVFRDGIVLADGSHSVREYIRHNGAVCVLALTRDGLVPLVRQYRYPVGDVLLELPAGKLGGKTETVEEAAGRELREETGVEAVRLFPLGEMLPTPAYTDEVIHLFWTNDVTFGEADPDPDEFLDVVWMPWNELVQAVMEGRIPDAKTQIAVLRVAALLNNHHES